MKHFKNARGEYFGFDSAVILPSDLTPLTESEEFLLLKKTIEECRRQGLRQIDTEAETARRLFITQGDGQAMVYQEKVEEAKRIAALADGTALDLARYPLLAAEAAALMVEVKALAATILTLRTQWLQIAAQIEATRIKAKEATKAAQTPEEVQEILNGLTWPKPTE